MRMTNTERISADDKLCCEEDKACCADDERGAYENRQISISPRGTKNARHLRYI